MDLKQLSALVAIADHGSFSAAARALHTVQSNISTHVARLERTLGATLVDRATGALTEEGRAVVERTRRIQSELEAIAADVASLHDEVSGTARLGVIGTTARWVVPPLVEQLRSQHPKVRLVVVDATTTSLIPQLAAGQLDLAVVNLPVDEPEVAVEQLFAEDAVLVVPTAHALADREQLTLADLALHELLLSAPGTAFRDELDTAASHAGVKLRPQAEIDGMRLLASLAFQGFGAAVLPASAAPGWVGGDWVRMPITDAPGRVVGLARRRRGLPSAPARALRAVLLGVVRAKGDGQRGIHLAGTDHADAGVRSSDGSITTLTGASIGAGGAPTTPNPG
jgi:LysR family hydrogen peroxide-inducible transcriptional activator